MSITSSLGREYEFGAATQWPTVLAITNGQERVSHTFEPAFMFQFEEKEEISTRIEIQIRSEDQVQKKAIDVRWIPVRVRHAAPIV